MRIQNKALVRIQNKAVDVGGLELFREDTKQGRIVLELFREDTKQGRIVLELFREDTKQGQNKAGKAINICFIIDDNNRLN